MRLVLSFLLSLLVIQFSGQLVIEWSDPLLVKEPEYWQGYYYPSVAVSNNGEIVLSYVHLYEDAQIAQIMTARIVGSEALDEQQVDISNSDEPRWNSIHSDGVNFFVVFQYETEGDIISRKSIDGGINWQSEVWVDEFLFGDHAEDPKFAIDGEGHPHVSMIRYTGADMDVGACCSVNLGDSYTLFIPASDNIAAEDIGRPDIAIYEDKHLVVWKVNVDGEVVRLYGALSTNNGATFGNAVVLKEWALENFMGSHMSEVEAFITDEEYGVVYSTESSVAKHRLLYGSLSEFGGEIVVMDVGDEGPAVHSDPCSFGNEDIICAMWSNDAGSEENLHGVMGTTGETLSAFEVPFDQIQSSLRDCEIAYANGVLHIVYLNSGSIYYRTGTVLSTEHEEFDRELEMLEIYPNPASDVIRLSYPSNPGSIIRIVDTNGRVVYESGLGNLNLALSVSHWPRGTYRVILDGSQASASFVLH
jgi:hypothetical protein